MEPVEMFICEIEHLFLHPDQLYIFRVNPDCDACLTYAAKSNPPDQSTRPEEYFEELSHFNGLPIVEATTKARAQGLRSRMTLIDGQPCIITADFVPTRVNFVVQDGVVVKASFG
jgi:hypothetical protein